MSNGPLDHGAGHQPLAALSTVDLDDRATDRIARMPAADYLRALASLTVEDVLFADRFGAGRQETLAGWRRAYDRVRTAATPADRAVRARLGLLCLTLELLAAAQEQARTGRSRTDFAAQDALLRDPDVAGLLVAVYAPDEAVGDAPAAVAAWSRLDVSALRLHRVGTTSFILRGDADPTNRGQVALKCVLYPYSADDSITHATQRYAARFAERGAPTAVVGAKASSTRWILMDYVDGPTLAEVLADAAARGVGRRETDLAFLERHGRRLIESLDQLAGTFGQHLDLTPSNVIIADEHLSSQRATLVDLGRNFLYDRRAGRLEPAESVFVAPEVKAGDAHPSSDAFSLGLLLAALADPSAARDGTIPDSIYERMPDFARFLEDLVDESPANRLVTVRPAADRGIYEAVGRSFDFHLALERRIRAAVPRKALVSEAWGLVRPSGGQVSQRHAIRTFVRESGAPGAARAGRLYFWSATAMAAWYVSFAAVLIWSARDFGLDLVPDSLAVLGRFAGDQDGVAFLDAVRAPGYVDGNWREYWPSRLICFALGLTEFKYYQSILAGLTASGMRVGGALRAEIMLRVVAVGTVLPILACVLVDPKLWPWAAFTGGVIITAANYSIYTYAYNCVVAAHHPHAQHPPVSTAPRLNDPNLEDYRSWWSSQFVYTVILLTAAVGLETGLFRDEGVYAVAIVGGTLGIQYVLKCHYTASRIRAVLNRAFLAGERVTALGGRGSPPARGA